jgi:RimJ/RimL family protein N-acetyltransferase
MEGEGIMMFTDIRDHPQGVAVAWRLLSERPAHANISHSSMPTPEEHAAFVQNNPYRNWFVIDDTTASSGERVPVGTIYATKQNEIGIAILMEHQRKGYARRAIREFMNCVPPLPAEQGLRSGRYVANVAPGNTASIELFTGLGAKLKQLTYEF